MSDKQLDESNEVNQPETVPDKSEVKLTSEDDSEDQISGALKTLLSFNDEELGIIGQNLPKYRFNFSSFDNLSRKIESDITGNELDVLMLFLKYVKNNIDIEKDAGDLPEKLKELLNYHGMHDDEANEIAPKLNIRLNKIFKNLQQKVDWYENSIIDNLLDLSGFIDIRPIFFDGKISRFIPVLVFRVALRKDFENPKIFVFQVSEEEFDSKVLDIVGKIKKELLSVSTVISTLNNNLTGEREDTHKRTKN